jgi:serine/threonine protein kinase
VSETSTRGDLTGKVIASQFRIDKRLGAGGMGQVYLAEQIDMGRDVVVKVMHPELSAGSETAVERFKREARAVAQLNHPNIVQVYVFGQTDDGQLYIAMEFVDGRPLTTELSKGRLPQARALRILDQTCAALSEAHGVGLVHRDLKPDNLMLTDRHGNPDYVKVLDFGIAKMLGEEGQANLTAAGAIFGTPRYMAPEQANAGKVDARTDLYALGVILYEMLSGAHPFKADSAVDFLIKHATEAVVLPTHRFDDIELLPRVEALLGKCLEKAPASRFQSAAELQREIRQTLRDLPDSARQDLTPDEPVGYAGQAPVSAVTMGTTGPPSKQAGKSTGFLIGVIAAALIVVGGGATGLYFGLRDKPRDGTPAIEKDLSALFVKGGSGEQEPEKAPEKEPEAAPGKQAEAKPPEKAPEKPPEKAPEKPPEKPPEPPVDVPPAAEMEGFPVPVGSKLVASMAQGLMLSTDLDGNRVVAFYKHHLAKYGEISAMGSALMVNGTDSPISSISLTRGFSGELNIYLQKNPLVARKADPTAAATTFGAPLFPGAEEMMRSGQTAVYTTKKPINEVIDFYQNFYKGRSDVMVYRNASPNMLSVMPQGDAPDLKFQVLAVMAYAGQADLTMISFTAK